MSKKRKLDKLAPDPWFAVLVKEMQDAEMIYLDIDGVTLHLDKYTPNWDI